MRFCIIIVSVQYYKTAKYYISYQVPAEKEINFIAPHPRASPERPREQGTLLPRFLSGAVTWRACVQQTTTSAASVHYMSTFTPPHAVFTALTERRNMDLYTV